MEGRAKAAKILRRKHPRELFFHHQVFFEGPEAGLLVSFKTWLPKEVGVANTVTLLFGIIVLKPDNCTDRNIKTWGQNVQPGTALGLRKGPILVSKKKYLTKTSPLPMPPTFPQLLTVLFRFSVWPFIYKSPYSASHFLFMTKDSEE